MKQEDRLVLEVFSLIENARTLAVRHHKRKLAAGVLKGVALYLEEVKVTYDVDLLQALIEDLKDKKPLVIDEMFDIIEREIISNMLSMSK